MSTVEAIQIRKATRDDLHLLFQVCGRAYAENFANHWDGEGLDDYLEKSYGLEAIRNDLANADIAYFVAWLNKEPAGFMKLKLNSGLSNSSAKSDMEIEKLYFRPKYQGKGIGKKLIDVALKTAQELNKKTIWLAVLEKNESAISFYKKMGFTILDKTRMEAPHFKDELRDMWRMKLDLKT